MTVLHREPVGDLGSRQVRKNVVAVAMAVLGLGAAFGLSQVLGEDASVAGSDPSIQARIEAGNAYGQALEQASELRAREQAGAAYGTALESASQAKVWSLDDELAAIHGGKPSVGSAAIAANASVLDSEIDAIHGELPFSGNDFKRTPNNLNIE